MKCLIDGDVLRYEIGYSGEFKDDDGEPQVREFEFVAELFDQKIKEIEAECWATEESIIFLTLDRRLHKALNKQREKDIKRLRKAQKDVPFEEVEKLESEVAKHVAAMEYKPNFRDAIAKKKEYKGNRKVNKKPFHYDNLTQYIMTNYNTVVAEGLEADDLMSVYQYERREELDTIICTRDKDLRITPGMSFGWPCGKQQQFGPKKIDGFGDLQIRGNKIRGEGLLFFYSQMLTGDTVDNIPGLPRCGPVKAYKILSECEDEGELFRAVAAEYENYYGDSWPEEMNEQANLLWMVRELNEDGSIVPYVMYDRRENADTEKT